MLKVFMSVSYALFVTRKKTYPAILFNDCEAFLVSLVYNPDKKYHHC